MRFMCHENSVRLPVRRTRVYPSIVYVVSIRLRINQRLRSHNLSALYKYAVIIIIIIIIIIKWLNCFIATQYTALSLLCDAKRLYDILKRLATP